jgi:hypothetical protein
MFTMSMEHSAPTSVDDYTEMSVRGNAMKKTLTALVAAATLAGAIAMPTDASAQWRRWGWGPGPALGAFAAGAIVAGALASRPYYGGYYGYYDGYYAPGPTYYYAPGPVQYEYYANPYYRPYDPCWRKTHGDRFAGCE